MVFPLWRLPAFSLESVEFVSGHDVMRGCGAEDAGWRYEGAPCPRPEWSPSRRGPALHDMGKPIRLAVRVGGASPDITGAASAGFHFVPLGDAHPGDGRVTLESTRSLPRRVQKLSLDIQWSTAGALAADSTSHLVYVTFGRPEEGRVRRFPEDGATVKRMDTAVSWVAPLETVDPHEIVEGLLSRFPYYTLAPSPKVPKRYGHPRYFNDAGGAWPMAEYPEESGECQAIARFIRGLMRQLGAPGEIRIRVVWADPRVNGGKKAIEADWEENPSAGLDATKRIRGKRCIAALVDGPVEEGRSYPPSHTVQKDGSTSPGLNRYEAFVRFSHGGRTGYYAAGASGTGSFPEDDSRLSVFWGLAWVSLTPDEGFRVEEIVARYR